MSLPPHRELPAKVEGRDPLVTVKETMAPFKSLMERLLRVSMSEVGEQQKFYDELREKQEPSPNARKRPKLKICQISSKDSSHQKDKRR